MKINPVNSTAVPLYTEQQQPSATAGQPRTAGGSSEADANPARLAKAVERLNNSAEAADRQVRFALYQDTQRIIVEVVDKKTNEVVATFPPKQILKMAEALESETININKAIDKEVK